MARLVANVDVQLDTFGSWITRTNELLESFSNEVLTANSTNGVTGTAANKRNATLYGNFNANTQYTSDSFQVANSFFANATSITISTTAKVRANNAVGTTGQILTLGSTGIIYWSNSANSSTYANNSTYAYGKQESQLYVGNAVFATTAGNVLGGVSNAVFATTANNSTYAYGKQESQLSVAISANAVFATSANNSLRLNGKQESQLSVANSVVSVSANSTTYFDGKTTWASPGAIGYTTSANGRFVGLEATGTLNVANNVTVGGTITANGNITAYSDINIKKNIEIIENALNKVTQIRGVTFNRIDLDENVRYAGVIAQEVEVVLPEVVTTNDNGLKSVAYGNMVSILIESIKELKKIVEYQQVQIDELKPR